MISRRALVVAFVLAACSGEDEKPRTFGGTIAGRAFAPADASGFLMEPRTCAQLDAGTHTIAWVQFSTAPGICALAELTSFCGERPDSVSAHVAIKRTDLDGDPVAPIGPGTYSSSIHGIVDANGVVHHFWAGVDRNGPACEPLPGGPKEGGEGTIVFEEVGPARIRGSATIAFDDGSALSGSFDVAVCTAPDAAFCDALKGGCSAILCAM